MERPLAGHSILVVEDEALIAIDLQQTFEDAGATVVIARTVTEAFRAVEDNKISAAIVDHALGGGDSS